MWWKWCYEKWWPCPILGDGVDWGHAAVKGDEQCIADQRWHRNEWEDEGSEGVEEKEQKVGRYRVGDVGWARGVGKGCADDVVL